MDIFRKNRQNLSSNETKVSSTNKQSFSVNRKLIFGILFFILLLPSFISLIKVGYFPMQDDLQTFRIHQIDQCFKDLQIPCRWVPDAGYQYGYPQFNYYPPSVYYLGELFHLIGFQFVDAVKIVFILGFVLSALTMFVLIRSFLGNFPALIGALAYTYIPYKALEVYVRGAMSEFWSLVIFPLIFWSAYKLIKTKKIAYFIWFVISIGLILTTHNLMSLIFLPVAGIWITVWIILEKHWKMFIIFLIASLLGLGLASFFTLPVLFERQYVHLETLLGGYFDYRQHFVAFHQLFLSNYWNYGSSEFGLKDELSLSTGPIQMLFATLAFLIAVWNLKILRFKDESLSFSSMNKIWPKIQGNENLKIAVVTVTLFITSLFVLFMMHQKSSFIWDKIPALFYLQFPWRFLAVSIFLLSLLSALTIYFVKSKTLKYILGVVFIIGVFIMHGSFFQPREWLNISDKEKFSGNLWEKQLTISIFDYLPIYAKFPPVSKAPQTPEILEGTASFEEYKKGSDFQIGKVIVEEDALIRLPLFDFPGMEVLANEQKITHINNDCRGQEFCLGLITFNLPKGEYTIKAELKDTPIRQIGNILTLVSIFLVFGLLIWGKKYEKYLN